LNKRAFTLVELLVVIVIGLILALAAAPSLIAVQRASALTVAGQNLGLQMSAARQIAIAQNRDVEFRFYRFIDPQNPFDSSPHIRAFQAFIYDSNGVSSHVSKVQKLSATILVDGGTTLSSLFSTAHQKNWTADDPQPSLPGIGTTYTTFIFRFRSNGGTDLTPFPSSPWCLTLHDQTAGDSLTNPPKNYLTIELDPINGHHTVYRP
jgi:uncharacterized protein (TIGR02596 family)